MSLIKTVTRNIKHAFRDSFVFFVEIFGISALYRFFIKKKGPLVRVIVFHDVADSVWFERVIAVLSTEFHVLTPAQFQTQEFNAEKINVLLTFDDGYLSWIENCLPVLTKHNLKGLFFINSGLLDCTDDERKVIRFMKEQLFITPKKALTWDGARTLVQEGHTIGGHSVTHPNLAIVDQASLENEILDDKKHIEAQLGVTLVHFAYPFGTKKHWNKNVLRFVVKAGYTFVYTTKAQFVSSGNYECVPRVCLEKNQSIGSITRWVKGGYDLFSNFK